MAEMRRCTLAIEAKSACKHCTRSCSHLGEVSCRQSTTKVTSAPYLPSSLHKSLASLQGPACEDHAAAGRCEGSARLVSQAAWVSSSSDQCCLATEVPPSQDLCSCGLGVEARAGSEG